MFGFNVNKLKPNLKMAVHRIGIVKNKKANAALAQRREVARLLADGKEEKARIRVEGIIRYDFTMEGYEILELMCELLDERAKLTKTEFDCPYDMREAVHIHLLGEVKKQLKKKYGHDFEAAAVRNMDGCVNERVIQKLSVQPPSAFLVVNYVKEIAKEFKVNWEPDGTQEADSLALITAPTGATVMRASVSRSEFTAIFASPPQSSANPPYLPCVPSSNPSTEATATAPAALQASVSRRTVDNYTNQPTHFYSTQQNSKINAVTGSQSLIKQHKLRKRLGILLLPHQPQQVMRLKAFQILTNSRHTSSDFASVKTVMTRRTSRLLSRRSCMKIINIFSIGTTLQYYVVFFLPARSQK
ncbi:hypothetical protein PsorP6_013310 [Peronosclerospora sorghi]|uniref:Uncharacterized protein n=1 Tax=Peronosclerospora sorghi TaxID=230839 RepID=A0ACC0WIC6_9STRA|nr:hypothetical protein PsorP6_013310 [Peronosclerospora sorghi]